MWMQQAIYARFSSNRVDNENWNKMKFSDHVVVFSSSFVVKILERLRNAEFVQQSLHRARSSLCRRSTNKVKQMHTLCITLLEPFHAHLFCCKMQIDRVFHPEPKNTNTNLFKCLEDKWKLLEKNNEAYNVEQQLKKGNEKYNKNKRNPTHTRRVCVCTVDCEIVVGEKKDRKNTYQLRVRAWEIELHEHCHLYTLCKAFVTSASASASTCKASIMNSRIFLHC